MVLLISGGLAGAASVFGNIIFYLNFLIFIINDIKSQYSC